MTKELKKGCVNVNFSNQNSQINKSIISEIQNLVKVKKNLDIFINQLNKNEFKYDISKWKF
jgi:hypothetical protein